jgi:hypothetical protein
MGQVPEAIATSRVRSAIYSPVGKGGKLFLLPRSEYHLAFQG